MQSRSSDRLCHSKGDENNEIQSLIKEKIIAALNIHDIGIQLVNITIQDSEPPTAEVMEAFKAVETAKQGKDTIEEKRQMTIRKLTMLIAIFFIIPIPPHLVKY